MNYQQQNEYLDKFKVYWNYSGKNYRDIWSHSLINPSGKRRIVNQKELTEFIKLNPGYTESEVMEELYNFVRGGLESNKKYADCIRRALRSRKICRCLCKPKKGGRKVFIYFIPN